MQMSLKCLALLLSLDKTLPDKVSHMMKICSNCVGLFYKLLHKMGKQDGKITGTRVICLATKCWLSDARAFKFIERRRSFSFRPNNCLLIRGIRRQDGKFKFLFIASKRSFWWTIFRNILQSSSEFTFLWNLGKFEIQLNQPRWPIEFIQNCTFSARQYRKKGTCLDFIFPQFVNYPLVILLS